jgi:erythromycin esterase-like protein
MRTHRRPSWLLLPALAAAIAVGCAGPAATPSPHGDASTAPPTDTASGSPARAPDATGPRPSGSAASPSAGRGSSPQPDPSSAVGADSADVAAIAAAVHPLTGAAEDYDALIDRIGDADLVLLGEPSHGSHEVYEERATITRRLIEEEGFAGLVIEGDWPDAWRVDRYVRGIGPDRSAAEALAGFDTFPEWMWRNEVFAEFVEWLRARNAPLPYERQAGVYGLDLYSLDESTDAAPVELRAIDPDAAERVADRYACTDGPVASDPSPGAPTCADQVREALRDAAAVVSSVDAARPERADRAFSASQHARIVVNGRRYTLGEDADGDSTWNIRDRHMAETVLALRDHLSRTGRSGRLVVWAHDSHVGDASATAMTDRGQIDLGQLVRERDDVEPVLVGFSTYTGTVTAADDWGLPGREMDVVPALPESHAALLHAVAVDGPDDFLVFLGPDAPAPLREERLERYIGVIYRPETERLSHYFESVIADEYDVVIHLDRTTAIRALAEP